MRSCKAYTCITDQLGIPILTRKALNIVKTSVKKTLSTWSDE